MLELLARDWRHAELGQVGLADGAVEDPEHDLLAVGGRENGDAQIERLAAETDRDAAVLRRAPLGDVELAHDLQTRDDRRLHRLRDGRDLTCHAVDPRAHHHLVLLGLEVDVGGAVLDRLRHRRVHELDGRALAAGLGDLLALGGPLELGLLG